MKTAVWITTCVCAFSIFSKALASLTLSDRDLQHMGGKYCGGHLSDMVSIVCHGKYNSPDKKSGIQVFVKYWLFWFIWDYLQWITQWSNTNTVKNFLIYRMTIRSCPSKTLSCCWRMKRVKGVLCRSVALKHVLSLSFSRTVDKERNWSHCWNWRLFTRRHFVITLKQHFILKINIHCKHCSRSWLPLSGHLTALERKLKSQRDVVTE